MMFTSPAGLLGFQNQTVQYLYIIFGQWRTDDDAPVRRRRDWRGACAPAADQILSLQRWAIRASAPEHAILESLDELPEAESFHNIDMIFEGLSTLRPCRLTELLSACTKVKVKRLFFVFADRHNHAWLKHVDRSLIDLGSGDRAFTNGGKLHPIYRITIPEEYFPREHEGANGP